MRAERDVAVAEVAAWRERCRRVSEEAAVLRDEADLGSTARWYIVAAVMTGLGLGLGVGITIQLDVTERQPCAEVAP